jgi:hypothetical protein
MMVEVLTKIPPSSSVDPPPVDLCEDVIGLFLRNEANDSASDDIALTAVKTIADALTRLLQFEWDMPREEVQRGLSSIILLAEGKLRKARKDHREVASRLMDTMEDMEKPWRIRLKAVMQIAETQLEEFLEPASYKDWQSANIGWLRNPKFFSPACCPVMKVGAAGVYESADEYMDTVLRLWVAMTFSDGFSVLAPHCRSRGPSGGCQNTLWPVAAGNVHLGNLRCRGRSCPNPVAFACRIKSHDALCNQCASRSIGNNLGGPGPNAATHMYDGKVESVSPDGVLLVSGFASRNPPPNIHWRTTKRLSPPNLVGVVRLRTKGSPLVDSDTIKWGEVVNHGHFRDEEARRQRGQVSVDLSSIVEFEPDFFCEGACVAIIDCMTFVPEWIPTLRALETQKQARLPFDNGKYLNLCKDNPVDTSNSVLDASSPDSVFLSDRRQLIETMIEESALEPIREIRRDEALKENLVAQLESLVVETTLDKMQLISFIDSLRNPVHLTQGPPGTG